VCDILTDVKGTPHAGAAAPPRVPHASPLLFAGVLPGAAGTCCQTPALTKPTKPCVLPLFVPAGGTIMVPQNGNAHALPPVSTGKAEDEEAAATPKGLTRRTNLSSTRKLLKLDELPPHVADALRSLDADGDGHIDVGELHLGAKEAETSIRKVCVAEGICVYGIRVACRRAHGGVHQRLPAGRIARY
jgi:hypothetical protein